MHEYGWVKFLNFTYNVYTYKLGNLFLVNADKIVYDPFRKNF